MTFETLFKQITAGKYNPVYETPPKKLDDNHIEDENQTVVWNRAFVKEQNEKRAMAIQRNKKTENACFKAFEEDLAYALMDEYNISQKQAEYLVSEAYEEAHSGGYMAVAQYAKNLVFFYSEMESRK